MSKTKTFLSRADYACAWGLNLQCIASSKQQAASSKQQAASSKQQAAKIIAALHQDFYFNFLFLLKRDPLSGVSPFLTIKTKN